MNPTNRQVSDWVQQQTDKKVLRQCAEGFNLSTRGSVKSLKERITAHLQTLQPDTFADWNPTMVNESNSSKTEPVLAFVIFMTILNLVLIVGLIAMTVLDKDDTGFNRDEIVQIVNQTNYDTCVADVEELNSVIPDPAMQLDPAATCG